MVTPTRLLMVTLSAGAATRPAFTLALAPTLTLLGLRYSPVIGPAAFVRLSWCLGP